MKTIFISMDTILQNREFPFFHIFHYIPLRNDLCLTLRWHLGHFDRNVSFSVLHRENNNVGYMLGYDSSMVRQWSIVYSSTKKLADFKFFITISAIIIWFDFVHFFFTLFSLNIIDLTSSKLYNNEFLFCIPSFCMQCWWLSQWSKILKKIWLL